jgi:hypothetical protein
MLGIVDQPFEAGARFLGFMEDRQCMENRFEARALGSEIAQCAHGFAADRRHQPRSPDAGRNARPIRTQRSNDEAQHQPLADRRKLGAQARLCGDLARSLRMIGVHLEMPGERAQCVLKLVVGARRHGKASGDQLRSASLRSREADHAQPLRRVLHERNHSERFSFALCCRVAPVALLRFIVCAH